MPDDHWTRWWYANRLFLLDLHGRVRERAPTTPGLAAGAAHAELWRAEAQQALTMALSDPDEDVATSAAVALGKAGDPADAQLLVPLLLDAKRQQPVREAAALGLGLLPPEKGAAKARVALEALEALAADEQEPERLRGFAVYALGLRGEAASAPFLLDAAHAGGATWDVAASGASALGMARCAMTFDDLRRMLAGPRHDRSRETMRRVYAAHGLARLGDPAAVFALRETVRDDDVEVRRASILALAALAPQDDAESADAIVGALHRDKDRGCRNMAAIALGRIAPERAAKELRWSFENSDTLERPFAALGLGLLARRTHDAEVAKLLLRGLEETGNTDVRGALSIACGLAGDLGAAPALRRLAGERGDPEMRAQAAMALGLVGDRDGAAPVLRSMLKDAPSPAMQREAAFALGLLGDRDAVKILLGLVADGTSVYVQGSAAVALGRIGSGESCGALVGMLNDKSRPGISRGMAAVALGLLLDRTEGRALASVGADLDWYALTPTVREILDIL